MSNTVRQSLKRRVVELIGRELPDELYCEAEEDGLRVKRRADGTPVVPDIPLEPLYRRVEEKPDERRTALYAFVSRVLAAVRGQTADRSLAGRESRIYPVLRHASLLRENPDRWVFRSHTEETAILYALDHGEGYTLIEREALAEAGWSEEMLHRRAMANLEGLPVPIKTEQVGPNRIHFISPRDGYAASRVLLTSMLEEMERSRTGDALGVAVPHQDVLIVADLHGETGAQLLARLAHDFASKGPVPISPLPFFWERGELVPFLVVQHGTQPRVRRKKNRRD
ncbi:DUF1444 family protein [Brevibacillus sp. WF146]|uniref:DUF1444 family protein n=1 Tax=Brevibacillus sp. WF146 TaxID=319501 RepID=UPI000A025609|nr:DUF1444 family protein [Brevibacillus sp. WF146]UYZ11494.1 DUF1444 family protein [Brevibacillus sp. WF146]